MKYEELAVDFEDELVLEAVEYDVMSTGVFEMVLKTRASGVVGGLRGMQEINREYV